MAGMNPCPVLALIPARTNNQPLNPWTLTSLIFLQYICTIHTVLSSFSFNSSAGRVWGILQSKKRNKYPSHARLQLTKLLYQTPLRCWLDPLRLNSFRVVVNSLFLFFFLSSVLCYTVDRWLSPVCRDYNTIQSILAYKPTSVSGSISPESIRIIRHEQDLE